MTASSRIIAEGRFLRLVDRNGWEFVERVRSDAVVTIVAITDSDALLLVEQFRVPLGRPVIELPAGLVGDTPEHAGESPDAAARRELLEETGHEAEGLLRLADTPSSAGLTAEVVAFYLALRPRRVSKAVGDGDEQIVLHEVPLPSLDAWLDSARSRGCAIDSKIYAGLHLARRRGAAAP